MITKVENGWLHDGVGHRYNWKTGSYPIYPLPRWKTYCYHYGEPRGYYADIYQYMCFCQDNYQTAWLEITGDEIADVICKQTNADPAAALQTLNKECGTDFKDWSAVYKRLNEVKRAEMAVALG
jgi:hypothetical protein